MHVRAALSLALGCAIVAGAGIAIAASPDPSPSAPPPTAVDHVIVGYFAGWDIYDRGYYPRDIPADQLTHVNYAFATANRKGHCQLLDPWGDYEAPFTAEQSVDGVRDADPGGAQRLYGNFNQLRKLKVAYPQLRVLISVGGWTESAFFSDAVQTPESRAAFAKSCIDMFIKGNLPIDPDAPDTGGTGSAAGIFDGIDIDWEYPVCCGNTGNHNRPKDRANATAMFQELRDQLDTLGAATGQHYLLTAAIPAGNEQAAVSYDLPAVAGILDFMNVMTYDFHGSWESITGFNSPFGMDPADPLPPEVLPFWNTSGAIGWFLSVGVPADKLVVGIPFYGNQYIRVANHNSGLYQPYDNTGMDSESSELESSTTVTYHQLVDVAHLVVDAGPGESWGIADGLPYAHYWNQAAGEPWLFGPAVERLGETTSVFIGYEDATSVAERVALVTDQGLRGAMIWELSQDSNSHRLVDTLAQGLR